MSEEEIRRIVLELRSVQARVEEAQRQLAALQAFTSDSSTALTTLKNLQQASGESLVPIGAGVFLKASVSDFQKVLLDVGASVVAEKTVEQAARALEQRVQQISGTAQKIQGDLHALLQRADELNARLAELSQKR